MIIHGDCLDEMRKMESNSISCIVTDPPYGLHFMGKDWDSFAKGKCKIGRMVPGMDSNSEAHEVGRYDSRRDCEFQQFIRLFGVEALRVIKPGGHILMFGSPRRYHRQTCGLEDAGWQIRDCLMWIFGSGFPKSHNKFGIEGYGTALKPAYEPIIMAMKPLDGTFAQNAEKWGQAGINIDGCRISAQAKSFNDLREIKTNDVYGKYNPANYDGSKGRWPANVLFDEEAAGMLDDQTRDVVHASGKSCAGDHSGSMFSGLGSADLGKRVDYPDSGGASRFFYCAKASSRERNEGLGELPDIPCGGFSGRADGSLGKQTIGKNNHPTVKPLKLMEYLIKLVMPPKDGVLLDPFAGSGSTILAAKRLGLRLSV